MAHWVAETQTISTSPFSGSYCQSDDVTINYTTTGSFNSGNTFTAQLSDEAGNFGSPVDIGSVSAITSGVISAKLPELVLSGTDYRIRVVSDDPVVVGSDNGSNIQILGDTNNPNGFGDNVWHVYSYDGDNVDISQNTYSGMYVHEGLNFNSTDKWAMNGTPSSSPGYVGCPIPVDFFSIR